MLLACSRARLLPSGLLPSGTQYATSTTQQDSFRPVSLSPCFSSSFQRLSCCFVSSVSVCARARARACARATLGACARIGAKAYLVWDFVLLFKPGRSSYQPTVYSSTHRIHTEATSSSILPPRSNSDCSLIACLVTNLVSAVHFSTVLCCAVRVTKFLDLPFPPCLTVS